MAKARKEGRLGDDFDGFLDDLLGAEPQQRHEAAAAREAVDMAAEIDPDNVPFSLSRRQFLPGNYPESLSKTITSTSVNALTKHPRYQEAKKEGNGEAAEAVVHDILKPGKVDELRRIIGGRAVIFAPVMHKDTGRRANALPMALADELAAALGGDVSEDIVKVSGAANTGASVQDRFANEQAFEGPVIAGGLYVVVDDNHTSGDTLAALIDHIQEGGGTVLAATALAHSQSQNYLKPRPADIAKLLDKAGISEDDFQSEFAFPIAAFTGSEAYRLANLDKGRGIAWLRSRISAGRSAANQGGSAGSQGETLGQGELAFSLAPRSLASVADTVLAAKMRKPEFRELYMTLARERLARMRSDGSWRKCLANLFSMRTKKKALCGHDGSGNYCPRVGRPHRSKE